MTPDRETLRIIASWMEDGRTRLPDHVFDAVLDQLPSTPQHRPRWRTGRLARANALGIYAITAAAVLAVAIAGLALRHPSGQVGGGMPMPTASPAPSPTPRVDLQGDLQPGRYAAHPLPPPHDALNVTFVVPEGWEAVADAGGLGLGLVPAGQRTGPPGGVAIQFIEVTTVNRDPCRWSGTAGDISIGPSVDDLVDALQAQSAYDVSDAIDVTIGGSRGKRIDIVTPAEPFDGQTAEAPGCDDGRFRLWSTTAHGNGSVYAQGPANRWQTNVLDVDGTRLVVVVQDFPGTSAADRAELDAIVESLVIEP